MQVVVVNTWHYATDTQVKTWLQGMGATFPAINEAYPYAFLNSYDEGAGFVPHSYIIGRDMKIRQEIPGAVGCDVMEGCLKDVLYLRPPVDIEMIMDVSDTMNSPPPTTPGGDPKLTLMRTAATKITDFLHDHGQVDDRMGLVWFTDDASEYVNGSGQKLLPVPTNTLKLKAQITARPTGICTAMGAGMQKAFDTLSASTHTRYAILCTDGMQNIDPKAAPVGGHYEIVDSGGWLCGTGHSSVLSHPGIDIAAYNTRVHTIGIGITATYTPLLQDIANATGGFYRSTYDPATDLDLIYFVDLCNSMAGGSPSVVHYHAGRLNAEACEAEEIFYLNRSVRKITVMLSWQQAQHGNLTFWLHAPDGTLLNLHAEMKQFESYCLATVYLPKQQDGKVLPYIGKWWMIIRGETQNSYADYHAFVIAEDHEIKFGIDFPRKVYKVDEMLPIHIKLIAREKPITEVNNILMEAIHLRQPLEKLVAQYELPPTKREVKRRPGMPCKDPVLQKLAAMQTDPSLIDRLKPVRTELSLKKGTLKCKTTEKEIVIPFALNQPGLCSFKITVQYKTRAEGPVHRIDYVSVHVA